MGPAASTLSAIVQGIRTYVRPALARIGRWALIGIVALAALIGVQHVLRGTAVRHVQGVGADGTPVAPGEPQFPLSVAMLTGVVLLPANQVEIALNGDGTLLDAGVRIYEWQPTTLHAKTFVADGLWATIGSMNFDNRSLTLNDESSLMILDEDVGQQMNAIFLDDLKHAEEIALARFRQRPWVQRLLERPARLIQRLL